MRVLRPADGIVAFYDGRVEGYRFAEGLNWVDDGALGLGIASYAIVDGDEAVVYDTHVSVEHARFVRADARGRGRHALRRRAQPQAPRPHRRHRGLRRLRGDRHDPHRRGARRPRDAIEAGTIAGPPGDRPARPPHPHVRGPHDPRRRPPAPRAHPRRHPQRRRRGACGCPPSACCSPATRSRTPSPMSPSPTASTATSPTSTRSGRPGPAPDPAQPRRPGRHRRRRLPKGLIDATQRLPPQAAALPDEPALRDAPLPELVADRGRRRVTYYAPYEAVHRENVAAVTASAP